uniref:Alpha-1,3-glucosyltransferase n=1 Tax=Lepeophtheirus salmonis TaxID=72036 RepID=A0A0K2U9V0_LEPSM
MFWEVTIALSCVKILFLHTYHSTDFEVHRNWLAVTHSLPIQQWYTDSCSEWTLDYPPFFAYFEWVLSHFAYAFDPEMLRIKNHYYASNETVLFQRGSVIFTDFVFAMGVKRCGGEYLGILANAGLLLVDHIHFQYNGFLFGLLFLSMGYAKNEQLLASGFWFAVLCNFKHIFAYTAPAYVVYLFGTYCFQSGHFKLDKLLILGLTVISVCVMSFGPFIYFGQFATVLLRLFPFKRGLVHAYWAPNFWALYNFLDKTISVILRVPTKASMTGGLVQEYSHTTLPSIPPSVTLIATLIFMMPCLWKLWKNVNHNRFLGAIVLCSWSSFLFGWHVHEKAILLIILPLALLAYSDRSYSKIYFITSVVGHFSLFPLLFESREIWIKLLVFLCHAAYTYNSLLSTSNKIGKRAAIKNSLSPLEKLYLLGLALVFIFKSLIFHNFPSLSKYEFLPLMFYSVYCGVGITYSWVLMNNQYLLS